MRAFIAIELSPEIRDSLAQTQSHLKYSGADVKWVNKENVHLTLKFLGEITEESSEKIKSILDEIANSVKPFEISIKDIGAFPKIEFPKVIWAGLDRGAAEASVIAGKIDDALSKVGFQKESRPFTAHLTIGRVRSLKNKEALKEKIDSYCIPDDSNQLIRSITLFQSTLTPKGSIYTKLHESEFSP